MDKAWHRHINVLCICCCTVLIDSLLFEAVLQIRIGNRNWIRKDPKLLAGSGSKINILDPDLNPDSNPGPKTDPKQTCKKEPYNQTKKQVISDNYFLKTFSRNNLIRISIFATQFTSNWFISRLHDSKKPLKILSRLWPNFITAD